MRYFFIFAFLALNTAHGPALAQPRPVHIYLNDVRLEGGELRGQTLTGVDVRFEDNGDIRILARGYRVTADTAGGASTSTPSPAQPWVQANPSTAAQALSHSSATGTTTPPPATSPLPTAAPLAAAVAPTAPASVQGKRYYIAPTPQARPGAAQYDVEVFVNGMAVRKFHSKAPELYVEITRWMRPGVLNAIRLVAHKEPGPRISASSADTFELILGTGELQGGQLLLEPLQRYRRNAAEVSDFNTEMTIDLTP